MYKEMKKILLIISLFFSVYSFGQMSLECDTTFFQCSKIFSEIKAYNNVYKRQHNDNQNWALVLKNVFPVDKDNLLHFTYVIKTDSVIDMEEVKKICAKWYGVAFTSQSASIEEQTDNYIFGTGQFNMIGQNTIPAVFYYKIIKVHAQIDIIMRFKENRLRFEIIGRHYKYISGDSSGYSHNDLIIPGTVYPFVDGQKPSDKEVYAQSYINFCNNSLAMARRFLDYLNKNIHPDTIQAEEDW